MSYDKDYYRARMLDLGDRLHSQFLELHKNPSPDRCEYLFRSLHGAQTEVRQLATELKKDA